MALLSNYFSISLAKFLFFISYFFLSLSFFFFFVGGGVEEVGDTNRPQGEYMKDDDISIWRIGVCRQMECSRERSIEYKEGLCSFE